MAEDTVAHYDLGEKIGEGGMGVVYKAIDRKLDRPVALKFLPTHLASSPEVIQRFRLEANAISKLNHPNIATIYALEDGGEQPFLVFEYVAGGTLKQKIQNAAAAGQTLSWHEILDIARCTGEALSHAHRRGIVHRDVKSANILLAEDGTPKLTDFGLAKLISGARNTRSGALLGTVAYMSPEQAKGEDADQRSDIFSFGVVLFEMATGRMPFEAANDVVLLSEIVNRPAPAVAKYRPGAPGRIERVISRALAKRVEQRYQSMDELLGDLALAEQEFAGPTIAKTESGTVTQPYRRFSRRKRAWLLVAGCAAGLLFAVSVPQVRDWAYTSMYREPVPVQKQLAILPFANNLGADPQNDALCAGLFEYVTNRLTELELFEETLRVVSSSEIVRGEVKSPRDALRSFGATLVVTASVQRDRKDVLVVMSLVDARTSLQLRAAIVRAPSSDLSNLQAEVLEKVASMLEVEFRHQERALAAAGSSAAPGASELYLKGRGFLLRYDRPENLDKAVESFGKALKADPKYALAHAGIAEAEWRRFRVSREGEHLQNARAECLKALALDDQLAPVHVTMGRIDAASGLFERAIESFRRALKLDPRNPDAPRELAGMFDALDRLEEAEAAYSTAITLRPHYWAVYNEMGAFKFRRGSYREAALYFEKVISLTPDNPLAYRNQGAVHLELGELGEAERLFQRSIDIQPTARSYSNLGTVYYYQERYAEAARMYERAVALAQNDARLWGNLADSYRWSPELSGKAPDTYRHAILVAEKELKLNPRDLPLRAYIALCRSALGEHVQATKEADEVVRLAPRDRTVLFRAAVVYEQAGERRRALRLIERALTAGFSIQQIRRAVPLAELRKDPQFERLEAQHANSQKIAQ